MLIDRLFFAFCFPYLLSPDLQPLTLLGGYSWTRLQPTTILIFLTLEQLKNATDWVRGDL